MPIENRWSARMRPWRWILFVALFSVQPLFAQTVSDLRAEFESLRKDLQAHEEEAAKNPINDVLATRYGPDAAVVTQNKLKIGGLLQIWFQSPQKDKTGNST